MNVKVTIYITNHNYAKYIKRSLNSCLNQSFKDYEIIIIDDGSTDNSKSVITKLSKNSPIITSIFQKNLGFIKTCNKALYAAKGKYILRLDADDWLHPNAIEIMYNYLERNKDAEFVFPDYYEVDHKGKIMSHIKRHDFKSVKLLDQPAHGACALFRVSTLKLNGGYDEKFTCQDGVDIWLCFQKKYKIHNINLPLFYYRKHPVSLTTNSQKILKNRTKIFFKNNQQDKKPTTVGFIPIRGSKYDGSSPEFVKLGGKKLIDWTIKNLLQSKFMKHIIISSPDDKVLKYVDEKKNNKLITHKRSSSLANANVMIDQSVNQAIKFYKKKKGISPKFILVSKINCPFIDPRHFDNSINAMQIHDLELLFGVKKINKFMFKHNGKSLKALRNIDSSFYKLENKSKFLLRLEKDEIYSEAGSFVVYKNLGNKISSNKNGKIGHEILDNLSAFELNSSLNWDLAQIISKKLKYFKTKI